MTSIAPSDTESNISGFIRYSDEEVNILYKSMIENMSLINQDILQVEENLKKLLCLSGPLESQLSAILKALPKSPNLVPMETD